MTAAGLRREAQRGRLVIERIAGKDFVTLAAIKEMRKLCRVQAKASATDAGATTITADRIEAARATLERTAKTLTARRKT